MTALFPLFMTLVYLARIMVVYRWFSVFRGGRISGLVAEQFGTTKEKIEFLIRPARPQCRKIPTFSQVAICLESDITAKVPICKGRLT